MDWLSLENSGNLIVSPRLLDTHFLRFNKYPVCEYHLLILTREFESQNDFLNFNDFKAAVLVMKTTESFVIYNMGPKSG